MHEGNQHGDSEYDDLQSWLDMTPGYTSHGPFQHHDCDQKSGKFHF